MNKNYDLIYITNIPSFYKVNLFNRIAKHRSILVIFTHDFSAKRNADFYKGEREFKFISIAHKSYLKKTIFILNLLNKTPYKHLIIAGWDQFVLWMAAFASPRKKTGLLLSQVFSRAA